MNDLLKQYFHEANATASSEGLVDGLKGLFSRKLHNKPDAERDLTARLRKRSEEIGREVKVTYANPKWLEKQELVEGKVSGAGVAGLLSIHGKMASDPVTLLREAMKSAASYVDEYGKAVAHYVGEINRLARPVKTFEDVQKVVVQLRALKRPVAAVPFHADKFPGGKLEVTDRHLEVGVHFTPAELNVELPAMSKEEIGKAAALILEMVSEAARVGDECVYWDSPDPDIVNNFDDYEGHEDHDAMMDFWTIVYDETFRENVNWPMNTFGLYLLRLANALEKWMDRSVK